MERFGRLDAAANVAGTHAGLGELTAECTEEDFDTQIRVNLRGTWLCVRAELRHMVIQGSGSIVNMSSVNGLTGLARGRLLDREARDPGTHANGGGGVRGHGIRVNAICPGLVDTPLTERALEIGGEDPRTASWRGCSRDIPAGRMATAGGDRRVRGVAVSRLGPYLTGRRSRSTAA